MSTPELKKFVAAGVSPKVGRALVLVREFSQAELARRAGVGKNPAVISPCKVGKQRLGWAAGTLSRLMSGGRQLKLRQLLDILRATNVRPSRFFLIVENPDTPFLAWPLTEGELEAWIERAVQRALAGQPKSD